MHQLWKNISFASEPPFQKAFGGLLTPDEAIRNIHYIIKQHVIVNEQLKKREKKWLITML